MKYDEMGFFSHDLSDSICRDRATSFCAKNSKGAAARNHKRAVADFRYETFIAECNREKVRSHILYLFCIMSLLPILFIQC